MAVLAGCSVGKITAPYQRQPTDPSFRVRGAYSLGSRQGTLWLDGARQRARFDTPDSSILTRGKGFIVIYPKRKTYFYYDPERQQRLEKARLIAERSRYYGAALHSGGLGLNDEVKALLAHPCQRAQIRLGVHADCQHSNLTTQVGPQTWNHARTDYGSLQGGFQRRTTTLTHLYDPARGLVLEEDYQSSLGTGQRSFRPDQQPVHPSDFEVPPHFQEELTEAQLTAQALPAVGYDKMVSGALWKIIDNYHDDYPTGEPDRHFAVTRERWYRGEFGSAQHQEILIWRLHAFRPLHLRQTGVLKKLNLQHLLSGKFVNPKADPPGDEPFPLEESSWAWVGPSQALYVRVVPDRGPLDARQVLLQLRKRPL